MARYIDCDRLLQVLEKNFGHTGGANTLKQLIDMQPTADVVEVVRCTDCIYCENMKCTELKDNTGQPLDVAIFDYCSQGIRK